MQMQLAKFLLNVIGIVFGLFSLLLAYVAAMRLYGWCETGRLAPPHRAMMDIYEVISYGGDPVRFVLEVGGNVFLLAMGILGVVTMFFLNRRGADGARNWPYLVPCVLIAVFWATVAAALGARRASWILPAATLFGLLGVGVAWSTLRERGLPINARISDMTEAFGRVKGSPRGLAVWPVLDNQNTRSEKRGRSLMIVATALLTMFMILKLFYR
jgi:hypothetical protein